MCNVIQKIPYRPPGVLLASYWRPPGGPNGSLAYRVCSSKYHLGWRKKLEGDKWSRYDEKAVREDSSRGGRRIQSWPVRRSESRMARIARGVGGGPVGVST